MSSAHLSCPNPDCEYGSAEFWLVPDGTIICADDECHAVFGRWTRDDGEAA